MGTENAVAELEARVALLLAHTDRLRQHIEAHEFDRAAIEASALELYCKGANAFANRIADAHRA